MQTNSIQLAGSLALALGPLQGSPDLLGSKTYLQLNGLLNLLW